MKIFNTNTAIYQALSTAKRCAPDISDCSLVVNTILAYFAPCKYEKFIEQRIRSHPIPVTFHRWLFIQSRGVDAIGSVLLVVNNRLKRTKKGTMKMASASCNNDCLLHPEEHFQGKLREKIPQVPFLT